MEVWKDVVGYEGSYEVSNLGRVKSLNYHRGEKAKILKQAIVKLGYAVVRLCKQGKSKDLKIHRLVAIAFIPNPKNKRTVNHINSIKDDNRVENLEWNTQKENVRHSWKNGLCKSKLTVKDVKDIRQLTKFFTRKELVIIFGVSITQIRNVVLRKQWEHI